jgi:hypothetical protein
MTNGLDVGKGGPMIVDDEAVEILVLGAWLSVADEVEDPGVLMIRLVLVVVG